MTPAEIRKLAKCLPFAEQGHGLEITQQGLCALANVLTVGINIEEYWTRGGSVGEREVLQLQLECALAGVEKLNL